MFGGCFPLWTFLMAKGRKERRKEEQQGENDKE